MRLRLKPTLFGVGVVGGRAVVLGADDAAGVACVVVAAAFFLLAAEVVDGTALRFLLPPLVCDAGALLTKFKQASTMRLSLPSLNFPFGSVRDTLSPKVDLRNFSTFRFMLEFQWFLMALSVLPGICLAISAHLFPRV